METLVQLCDTFSILQAVFLPFAFGQVQGVGCNILRFQLLKIGGPLDGHTQCETGHHPDCCVAIQL